MRDYKQLWKKEVSWPVIKKRRKKVSWPFASNVCSFLSPEDDLELSESDSDSDWALSTKSTRCSDPWMLSESAGFQLFGFSGSTPKGMSRWWQHITIKPTADGRHCHPPSWHGYRKWCRAVCFAPSVKHLVLCTVCQIQMSSDPLPVFPTQTAEFLPPS